MKKRIFALVLAAIIAMLTLGLAGCGETKEDWEYIAENGKMVIGYTDFAPMNYYEEDGTLIGFDTELAEAVCEKLGVEPEFKEIIWDSKETELNSKAIDCIWNGFTVDEERAQTFDFTQNYLTNRQVIVIQKDNVDKYKTLDSLKEATFVAEKGSAGATVIAEQKLTTNYTDVESQAKALLEVKSGTSEAAVIDAVMANYLVNMDTDYNDLYVLNDDSMKISDSEFYGIGFRKGSPETVKKVNAAIDELKADGTYAKLAEKYGLSDVMIAE